MAEILVVVLDRANDISFHDLHVVDVVEQFEMVACDLFAQFDAPGGQIAHVVGVIDPAIEKLHVEDDIFFLGHRSDLAQRFGAVLHSGFAVDPASVSGEADHVSETCERCCFDRFFERFECFIPELRLAEPIGELMRGDHGTNQSVLLEGIEVFRTEQIDPA